MKNRIAQAIAAALLLATLLLAATAPAIPPGPKIMAEPTPTIIK